MPYLPIDLWNTVIHPSLLNPVEDIGIEVVIALQTVSLAAELPAALIAVDTERRNAELYPRFNLAHSAVQLIYEGVHVLSSPCTLVFGPAALEPLVIGKLLADCGIWIEIVIDMQSIDIVTVHDITHNTAYIVAVALQ